MSRIRWTTPPPTDWSAESDSEALYADLPSESLKCHSVGDLQCLWRTRFHRSKPTLDAEIGST
jgi:hypothetical protein